LPLGFFASFGFRFSLLPLELLLLEERPDEVVELLGLELGPEVEAELELGKLDLPPPLVEPGPLLPPVAPPLFEPPV
jgi:hypothetical protein